MYNHFKSFFPSLSLPIVKDKKCFKYCSTDYQSQQEMSKIRCRNVIDCLSFIASLTKPYISYSINSFSQFQSNPVHWNSLANFWVMLKVLQILNCI